MVVGVGLLQRGQTVVNRVRRREARTFEADPAQQDVGLHDVVQCRRDDLPLVGPLRVGTVAQERVVTEPGQGQPREGGVSAALVRRLGAFTGSGFEPGRQGVAHTGHQKTGGGRGDHPRVHQHHLGVHPLVGDRLEDPLLGVDHGATATGGVGGGDGGNDQHRDPRPVSGDLRRVHGLPAAHPDKDIHALPADDLR